MVKDRDGSGPVYSSVEREALDCLDDILTLGFAKDERPYTYMQKLLETILREPGVVRVMLDRLKKINGEREIDARTIDDLPEEMDSICN